MHRPLATLLLSFTLAALFATSVLASGVNLSWNDCGIAGSVNKSFACNSNTLDAVIVGSFQPTYGTFMATSLYARIDLMSAGSALPSWWSFKNVGSCRPTSLTASANFTGGAYSCADPWLGGASGGLTSYVTNRFGDPRRVHIDVVYAVPQANAAQLDSPNEYLGFMLKINGAKTVGTGACDGCLTPVCVVWNWLGLDGLNGTYIHTSFPLDHNYVTWQGGVVSGGCPAATPVRNRTWGQVKSLYY